MTGDKKLRKPKDLYDLPHEKGWKKKTDQKVIEHLSRPLTPSERKLLATLL